MCLALCGPSLKIISGRTVMFIYLTCPWPLFDYDLLFTPFFVQLIHWNVIYYLDPLTYSLFLKLCMKYGAYVKLCMQISASALCELYWAFLFCFLNWSIELLTACTILLAPFNSLFGLPWQWPTDLLSGFGSLTTCKVFACKFYLWRWLTLIFWLNFLLLE